jgi:cellobiose-specific phosphotransferase system component IIB
MTKESAMEKAAQESLAKFARERDLFLMNPQLKLDKQELTEKILLKIDSIKRTEYELMNLKEDLLHYAQEAIDLEKQGIFWADKDFSVCHAAKRKNEKAMLALVNPDQFSQYDTLLKEAKTLKTTLLKSVNPIYLESRPTIKMRSEKENLDYDNE